MVAHELQADLFKEYPKLVHCGGFQLLRASDIGGKELIPIEMPHGGYSVEIYKQLLSQLKSISGPFKEI